MKKKKLPHLTLSDEDYGVRVATLYEKAAATLANGADEHATSRELEMAEWDLTIDHRLGQDTPEPLRKALHEYKRELETRRDDLIEQHRQERVSSPVYLWKLNNLPRKLAKEFESKIPRPYFRRLMGPVFLLPIDPRLLRRK